MKEGEIGDVGLGFDRRLDIRVGDPREWGWTNGV